MDADYRHIRNAVSQHCVLWDGLHIRMHKIYLEDSSISQTTEIKLRFGKIIWTHEEKKDKTDNRSFTCELSYVIARSKCTVWPKPTNEENNNTARKWR